MAAYYLVGPLYRFFPKLGIGGEKLQKPFYIPGL